MHVHIPPPDRHGASVMHISPTDNQQAPQLSQDKKNGKNTPFLGLPVSSIDAAVLWLLWIENPCFLDMKTLASLTGDIWEALQCIILHQRYPDGACRLFKVLTLNCAKIFKLIIIYVGVYGGT